MPRPLRRSWAPSSALAWNSSTKTAVAPACGSANGSTKKIRAKGDANHAKLCVDTHWWLPFYETKPVRDPQNHRDPRVDKFLVQPNSFRCLLPVSRQQIPCSSSLGNPLRKFLSF